MPLTPPGHRLTKTRVPRNYTDVDIDAAPTPPSAVSIPTDGKLSEAVSDDRDRKLYSYFKSMADSMETLASRVSQAETNLTWRRTSGDNEVVDVHIERRVLQAVGQQLHSGTVESLDAAICQDRARR